METTVTQELLFGGGGSISNFRKTLSRNPSSLEFLLFTFDAMSGPSIDDLFSTAIFLAQVVCQGRIDMDLGLPGGYGKSFMITTSKSEKDRNILWEKNLGFSRMVHFFLLLSPIKAKREGVLMSQNLK